MQKEFTLTTKDNLILTGQEWLPSKNVRGVVSLIHGLGEHSGRYLHVANAFNEAGFSLIGFDLRGHGGSGGQRGHAPSYDAICDDIDLLLSYNARKYPSVPQFLYGHSMGGAITLYYCLKRKPAIQGVIVTSPGLSPAHAVPGWKTTLGKLSYRFFPNLVLDNGLDIDGISRDSTVVKAYRQDPLVHGKVSARLGMEIIINGKWVLEHAADFTLPLLLMQGGNDRIISPPATRQFAERVKCDIRFVEIDDGFHELHNDLEKERVVNEIVGWMISNLS